MESSRDDSTVRDIARSEWREYRKQSSSIPAAQLSALFARLPRKKMIRRVSPVWAARAATPAALIHTGVKMNPTHLYNKWKAAIHVPVPHGSFLESITTANDLVQHCMMFRAFAVRLFLMSFRPWIGCMTHFDLDFASDVPTPIEIMDDDFDVHADRRIWLKESTPLFEVFDLLCASPSNRIRFVRVEGSDVIGYLTERLLRTPSARWTRVESLCVISRDEEHVAPFVDMCPNVTMLTVQVPTLTIGACQRWMKPSSSLQHLTYENVKDHTTDMTAIRMLLPHMSGLVSFTYSAHPPTLYATVTDILVSLPINLTHLRLINTFHTRASILSDGYAALHTFSSSPAAVTHTERSRRNITHLDLSTWFREEEDASIPYDNGPVAHWITQYFPNLVVVMAGCLHKDHLDSFKRILFTQCQSLRALVIPGLFYTHVHEENSTALLFKHPVGKPRGGGSMVASRDEPPMLTYFHRDPLWLPLSTLPPTHAVHDILSLAEDFQTNDYDGECTVFFRP
jgi:hypothetical protein